MAESPVGDTYNFENPGATIGIQIGKVEHYHNQISSRERLSAPYFYPHDRGSSTFVGRNNELEQLHQLLQSSQRVGIVAATGMGGIGKTELAWQYVHQHRLDYPGGIWWVSASNLIGDILTYGMRMKLPEAPDKLKSVEAQVQWYYDRWGEMIPEGKRLLVWDDVSDYGKVRLLLPQDERYHVLLTTRAKLGPPVQTLELEVLKPEAAVELLRQLVGDENRMEPKAAQALCEWLGRLPLGIELVGRHLAGRPTLRLARLLERLEEQRLQAKALQQVTSEMLYRDNLKAAFELSWQLLHESAKCLGGLLSVFALAPIKREWVVTILEEWDEEELEEAEEALLRWSFISLEEEQYLLHTLIREFFAEKLISEFSDIAEDLQDGMVSAMWAEARVIRKPLTAVEVARLQFAVPHLHLVVTEFANNLMGIHLPICFAALARVAEEQSCWQEAQRWYEACLEMSKKRFGMENPFTAMSLNNLASLYKSIGQYQEALPLYEQALVIYERLFGRDDPDTVTVLNNLGAIYESTGQYTKAEPFLVRSLEISQRVLGDSHPDTARSLNSLACLYESMGRYEEALPLYERALVIYERRYGKEHPDTIIILNNLGAIYESMGKYEEALLLHEQSLTIRKAHLGENHPDIAMSLNNLAGLYESMGRYEEALLLYDQSLEALEQAFGSEHPDTATSLNNLALLYKSMGRYEEALPLYERSLSIRERLLGSGHPETALSLNNLAMLYYMMEQYEDAQLLWIQSIEILTKSLGEAHPKTQQVMSNFHFLESI